MKPSCFPKTLAATALALLVALAGSALGAPAAGHVLVVGVDGMRADGYQKADAPNMKRLAAAGAHTVTAQAVLPTVSSPNWASILMGAEPSTHKITSNDWKPEQVNLLPTLFGAVKKQRKEACVVVTYEWMAFGELFAHESVDVKVGTLRLAVQPEPKPAAHQFVTDAAAAAIREKKPMLTFIHLDLVDHAGHAHGYDSAEYLASIAEADRCLGLLLEALEDAGIAQETVTLVVSDHGGKGTGHGGDSPEELTVPWIIAGPGVAQGKVIAEPVCVTQTAPTVLRALGLKIPRPWTAGPVKNAFAACN